MIKFKISNKAKNYLNLKIKIKNTFNLRKEEKLSMKKFFIFLKLNWEAKSKVDCKLSPFKHKISFES